MIATIYFLNGANEYTLAVLITSPMPQFITAKYFLEQPEVDAPVLGLAQSFWALTERDIPITKSLQAACKEGFEYFEVGLRDERLAQTRELLDAFPLKLIAQGFATSADEAACYLQRAVDLKAVALNLHLGHAYLAASEAVDMAGEVYRQAQAYGMPLLLETHRGRLTQDLFRTTEIIRQLPEVVIALDLSHYIVAGETLGGSEELFRAHVEPLLARTALIHGRISNGQSIQVAIEDRFAFTSIIQSLWQRAMQFWLANAPASAVFLFEPELGPPPYAYLAQDGSETFDRTAQTRALAELGRQTWDAARATINISSGSHYES